MVPGLESMFLSNVTAADMRRWNESLTRSICDQLKLLQLMLLGSRYEMDASSARLTQWGIHAVFVAW